MSIDYAVIVHGRGAPGGHWTAAIAEDGLRA